MIKKITSVLFSTRTTGIMLLLFALAMATGTFVENDYGTPTAKALIYNCWWFELIMLILVLNFAGNIKRYNLLRRDKIPVLIFHIAFIIIFVGGFITRFFGFEGMVHIREKESSNTIISDQTFFKVQIGNKDDVRAYDDYPVTLVQSDIPFYLAPFSKKFDQKYQFNDDVFKFRVIDFCPRAQDSLVKKETAKKVLQLVVLDNGRVNKFIASGSVQLIQNTLVSYNKFTAGALNINDAQDRLEISSPHAGEYMIMVTQEKKEVKGGEQKQQLNLKSLYTINGLTFVVPNAPIRGEVLHFSGDKHKHENASDLITVEITAPKQTDTVEFFGGKGLADYQHQSEVDGYKISLAYGSKLYTTPFALKLTDFVMDKYPGSDSPSSYSSQITIEDNGTFIPYHISMNHVLDYSGYRFFQASFDQDELGTVLSVNHDRPGTLTTYVGYTLLSIGMFLTLFWKGTRFDRIKKNLKKYSKSALLVLLFIAPVSLYAQKIDMHGKNSTDLHDPHTAAQSAHKEHQHAASNAEDNNTILMQPTLEGKAFASTIHIDPEHSSRFGALLVQNFDGRIEPVNTTALEIIRKLYHKDHFYNLDANQFFLSINTDPFSWIRVPLIAVNAKAGKKLLAKVKANEDGKTSMLNLMKIDGNGNPEFILGDDYKRAFAKKASDQDVYDKEVIQLNDKLYVMQRLLNGQYLRVIPIPGDKKNSWVSVATDPKDDNIRNTALLLYFQSVVSSQKSGVWMASDHALDQLKAIQLKLAGSLIPSELKISAELIYNSSNIFLNLMIAYAILGTAILFLAFGKLFSDHKLIGRSIKFVLMLIIVSACLQGIALGVRWYISGHEPWSNGYEAVLFISWIGILSGLTLYKNSNAFIPAAGCLIAVILMGFAHAGTQMNPQITPLVPVLKSYWLMVHVAIITSSYGFFGLSALIGVVVLVLYAINSPGIAMKVEKSIKELTVVNEMSLTIGIFLLTIGTFLGGVWANESWGRYWSWDPKETWAFISVIIYAFVLHVRLIPGLQSKYMFSLLSVISFFSIIMTYFGVNYYLTGLHSYAQGDPVPIPSWVYYTIALLIILCIVAFRGNRLSAKFKYAGSQSRHS